MRPESRRALVVALGLILTGCAVAGPPALWTNYSDRPKGYLAAGEGPDLVRLLPPPPTADSPAARADAEINSRTRALQGTPRWTLAARDAELYTPDAALGAFACALGADIPPQAAPRTALLLGRIPADVDQVQAAAKRSFARPRPFVATPGPICVAEASWLRASGSYPSGHAATGWAWALILARLAPDHAEAILARGLTLGDSRVVCGVHYQSDVDAGRISGAALLAELDSRPDFQRDVQAAKAELAQARRAAPRPNCSDSPETTRF